MIKLKPTDPRYKINESRKVFVYKNLHKNCWSLKQDGLVKAHTKEVCLYDCSFRVNQKGRERVVQEKRKNVHAGVSGYIDTPWAEQRSPPVHIELAMYNPYKYECFVCVKKDTDPVFWSPSARLSTAKNQSQKDKVEFVPCISWANKL